MAGVEADRGWANKTTTLVGMVYPATGLITGLAADTFSVKTGWDASVRGRLGVLLDPTLLLYETGGAAWLHVESTSTCGAAPISGPMPARAIESGRHRQLRHQARLDSRRRHRNHAVVELARPRRIPLCRLGAISNTDTRTSSAGVVETVLYELRVRTHTATFGLAYKFD